jgi:hypothetical protein
MQFIELFINCGADIFVKNHNQHTAFNVMKVLLAITWHAEAIIKEDLYVRDWGKDWAGCKESFGEFHS